ncbi:TetR/AcrR family transcriptional regulator [Nocardia panacis]|uniref:TetR/AcrR family transcriptional regulator n=1 Tax=Nocardia panacis TaxID=2340916 RepID=A0A3A4KGP0_9NOCA|nr:TetR/AcrR family transcriptional regulator [Nocardia panacis]RJO75158.1 TetR/AcrR family transcriptional regulator [Nocardia panacis]
MQVTARPSPAAVARRAQILAAAIEVLAESGYTQTSFARIAHRAGISSTRLISYHFSGKEDLMRAVAERVRDSAIEYMMPRLDAAPTHRMRLAAYLAANLEFLRDRTTELRALIELAFNAQAALGKPFLPEDQPDAPLAALTRLLEAGQNAGEFRDFDPKIMAMTIRAAIDTLAVHYAADTSLDLNHYAAQLVTLFELATGN